MSSAVAGRPTSDGAGAEPPAGAQATQTRLQAVAEPRHEQAHAEADQREHRERPQQVVGQAERGDHVNQRDRREREGQREARHDPQRPAATAGDAGRERDRQDREHARRDRRGGAGDEREGDQDDHEGNLDG